MSIQRRTALFLVSAAAFTVYAVAINAPFVLDDGHTIIGNPGLRDLSDLKAVFTSDSPGRPFLYLTFALNFAAGGLNPFGYHVVNIALHCAVSCVVFLLLAHLLGDRDEDRVWALLGALLFAVHPMNTEAVTYVSSRSDVLSVFFYYLPFLLAVAAGFRLNAKGGAALLFFALALLTKEIAVTLPALLVVYLLLFQRERLRQSLPLLGAMWGLLPVYFLYRAFAIGHALEKGGAGELISPVNYFFTQLTVVPFRYFPRLLVPIEQDFDADLWVKSSLADPPVIAGGAAIAAVLVLAFIYARRFPALSFAAFCFLGTLSVTSSFYPILDTYAERRLYIALPAFALAVAWLFREMAARRPSSRRLLIGVFTFIVIVFALLAVQRNMLYRSTITLMEDAAGRNVEKYRMNIALFEEYAANGMDDKADAQMRLALMRFGNSATVRLKYCWWLANKGDLEGIRRELALITPEKKREWASYYGFKGVLAAEAGNNEEALEWLNKALEQLEDHVDSRANKIILLNRMGRRDEALRVAREAVQRWPLHPDFQFQLGQLLLEEDRAAAAGIFAAVLELDPKHRGARMALEKMRGM